MKPRSNPLPPGWWPPRGTELKLLLIAAGFVLMMPVIGILLARNLAAAPHPTPTATGSAPAAASSPVAASPATRVPGAATQASTGLPAGSPSPTAPAEPTATAQTVFTGSQPPACTAAGQTWERPADHMRMVCVPAGSFPMGLKTCDFQGCEKEVNGGSVDLPAFWIDRSEVTNAMFQQFVTQTAFVTDAEKAGSSEVNGQPRPVPGANWRAPRGQGSSIDGLNDYPVVQMDWYAAHAYCQWAGGQLPSEAEWEKAARGTDGRLWPWGSTPPTSSLVNAADLSLAMPQARKDQNDGYRYTAPVGSFPDGQSPYGLMDMAGNAWEWTRSIYKDYPYRANDGREVQTAPAPGDKLVLRGASWFDDYGSLRSTLRYGGIPGGASDSLGFRCEKP